MSLVQRVRQGFAALNPRPPANLDALLGELLTPAQIAAFRALSDHDQAHLARVCLTLRQDGETDRELLVAALLHDLGKVSDGATVRLVDRVARVLLNRFAPRLLARWATWPAPRWRRGVALAHLHPRLGAERAARLGCSDRTCWLIAHHEDASPPPDRDLLRLIDVDHRTH